MKVWICVAALVCLTSFSSDAQSQQTGTQQIGTPRALFAADYQKKLAAWIDADQSVRMQREIRDIHDVQQLPNGHWLLQTSFQNVLELDKTGEVVWKYEAGKSPKGGPIEIHAFRRLPNGLTMIAESGAARIIEVDRAGKVTHTIPLAIENPDPHRDTRLVRPTPEGNYVVAHEALVGTGDGHRVIEVSPGKEIVWEVTERELPGVQLAWITMVDRLENGNTWIVNCHAGPENPQILEVAPDKKVVWSFKDFDRFGNALPVALPITPSKR